MSASREQSGLASQGILTPGMNKEDRVTLTVMHSQQAVTGEAVGCHVEDNEDFKTQLLAERTETLPNLLVFYHRVRSIVSSLMPQLAQLRFTHISRDNCCTSRQRPIVKSL